MQETTESTSNTECNVVNELCDALRYLGDASYAILPKDMAHNLGDLKKSFLSTIRTLFDKDIEWVEARVSGYRKLLPPYADGVDPQVSLRWDLAGSLRIAI